MHEGSYTIHSIQGYVLRIISKPWRVQGILFWGAIMKVNTMSLPSLGNKALQLTCPTKSKSNDYSSDGQAYSPYG